MHVSELWRHPVKSLQGEPLDEVTVENSGLLGDRKWGIVDQETGMVLTARRVPLLLLASARVGINGVWHRHNRSSILARCDHTATGGAARRVWPV